MNEEKNNNNKYLPIILFQKNKIKNKKSKMR